MDNVQILAVLGEISTPSLMGWLGLLTYRVLREVRVANVELKKLIALLLVPVNAMFQDAEQGKIKLTPEGEAVKSITQEKQGNPTLFLDQERQDL